MIKDLIPGNPVQGTFLIKEAIKIDKGEQSYLNITLQDSSGSVNAKKWNCKDEDVEILQAGNIVDIAGGLTLYKERLQLRIDTCSIAEDPNMEDFLMCSPIPSNELDSRIRAYVKSITTPELKIILNEIFKKYYSKFLEYPAAVKNHHEFVHGLVHHTLYMCDLAEQISKIYHDVNRDLLISGCILHDIGKIIELSGPVAPKYTTEGNLLGHLSIGMSIVREIAHENKIEGDYPILLEHMILSHHGKLEYGSCVLPCTREALLLSMIDDLDAKMMILDKAYDGIEKGQSTEKIFALDNRSFYKGDI